MSVTHSYGTSIDVRRVAQAALVLVRSGWCKQWLAVDRFGRPVFTTSPDAVRYSLFGALKCAAQRLHGRDWARVVDAAREALAPICGADLSDWNDSPGRWKGEILDVLEGL